VHCKAVLQGSALQGHLYFTYLVRPTDGSPLDTIVRFSTTLEAHPSVFLLESNLGVSSTNLDGVWHVTGTGVGQSVLRELPFAAQGLAPGDSFPEALEGCDNLISVSPT